MAALAAGCLVVASCSAQQPAAQRGLTWTPCEGPDRQTRECSSLQVPLDYADTTADTTGPTIDLALARIPARGPGTRLGSILVDPGGPGISGVDEIQRRGRGPL